MSNEERITESLTRHQQHRLTRILLLFAASHLVTLVLTVIPVVADLPAIDQRGWYVGEDIIRLVEPLVILSLSFWIMWESPVCQTRSQDAFVSWMLFMFASSVYQQGAGFHSAAALFKKPVAQFNRAHPEAVTAYPELNEIYSWIRDYWEHVVSHYMYAAGGIAVSFLQCYVYRKEESFGEPGHWFALNKKQLVLFVVNVILYGLIVGAVAINFPSGSIVALILCIAYGFGILGTYSFRRCKKQGQFVLASLPIVHQFVLAYAVGLLVVIGWMSRHGLSNRLDAGVVF